jgi:hypothetical protein
MEDAYARSSIASADLAERRSDSRLDRAGTSGVRTSPTCSEAKHGAPSIARIVDAPQQPLRDQPLQDAGQGARVHTHDRREIAGAQPREETDHAEHEALWSCHADVAGHALGRALQAVRDGPEQLQELQDVRQRIRHRGGVRWNVRHSAIILCSN